LIKSRHGLRFFVIGACLSPRCAQPGAGNFAARSLACFCCVFFVASVTRDARADSQKRVANRLYANGMMLLISEQACYPVPICLDRHKFETERDLGAGVSLAAPEQARTQIDTVRNRGSPFPPAELLSNAGAFS